MKSLLSLLIFIQCSLLIAQNFKLFEKEILNSPQNRITASSLLKTTDELLFIGDYKNALKLNDCSMYLNGRFINNNLNKQDTIPYYSTDYELQPAKKYIVEKAKSEKIIIINEAHNQPLHRVFTTTLLNELYALGFRYCAIEALSEDSLLNIDKYPKWTTGYYSAEPQFGNLIREALSIGYKLIAYEAKEEFIMDVDKREYEQAKNIKNRTFDIDPNAKVLIHCGYAHGLETPGKITFMGAWLKKLTGIDPLNISQTELSEHSNPEYENRIYKWINGEVSSVLVPKGALFNLFCQYNEPSDIIIFHPRTKYIANRPNWINLSGDKIYYFPTNDTRITLDYPLSIRAYCINEDITKAIPTDCIQLTSKSEEKALLLKSGKYLLVIKNDKSQEQSIEIHIKK